MWQRAVVAAVAVGCGWGSSVAAQMGTVGTPPPPPAAIGPAPVAASAAEARRLLVVERDKFDGRRWVTIGTPPANLPGLGAYGEVRVAPAYFSFPDGARGYYLVVSGIFSDWAFLSGQMDLLIDGEPAHLLHPLAEPTHEVLGGSSVSEVFRVALPYAVLLRLGDAHQVEVRLPGKRWSVVSKFRPAHLAQFRLMRWAPSQLGESPPDTTAE